MPIEKTEMEQPEVWRIRFNELEASVDGLAQQMERLERASPGEADLARGTEYTSIVRGRDFWRNEEILGWYLVTSETNKAPKLDGAHTRSQFFPTKEMAEDERDRFLRRSGRRSGYMSQASPGEADLAQHPVGLCKDSACPVCPIQMQTIRNDVFSKLGQAASDMELNNAAEVIALRFQELEAGVPLAQTAIFALDGALV